MELKLTLVHMQIFVVISCTESEYFSTNHGTLRLMSWKKPPNIRPVLVNPLSSSSPPWLLAPWPPPAYKTSMQLFYVLITILLHCISPRVCTYRYARGFQSNRRVPCRWWKNGCRIQKQVNSLKNALFSFSFISQFLKTWVGQKGSNSTANFHYIGALKE